MQPQADIPYTRKLPALEELQARRQWVCWRKEERQGKLTKVPYSPRIAQRDWELENRAIVYESKTGYGWRR